MKSACLAGKTLIIDGLFNWKYEDDETALDLREFYKRLIKLRRENTLLQTGRFEFIKSPRELLHIEDTMKAAALPA